MIVEPLEPRLEDAYERFVRSHPGGLFYYSLSYRRLLLELLECTDAYLVVHDEHEVRGVLPLLRLNDPDGHVYNSLPYYGSNGGVLAADAEAAATLTESYDQRALDEATLSSTVVSNPFAQDTPPPAYTHTDERIAHFTDLEGDPLDRVEASARRNVRRAESAGIVARIDRDALPDLHRLHDENIRALNGRPKSRAFFDLVPRVLAEDEWQLFVADAGGEVVAALLVMYFEGTVEYFTPAIDHRYRSEQPLAALLAAAMRDAAARGYRRWNWGGTWLSQESLRRFKLKWGAEERAYRYFVQVNREDLLDATPDQLRRRFGDFFAVPYGALRG